MLTLYCHGYSKFVRFIRASQWTLKIQQKFPFFLEQKAEPKFIFCLINIRRNTTHNAVFHSEKCQVSSNPAKEATNH